MLPSNSNYLKVFISLKEKIRQARLRAVLSANAQMLTMYWEVGNAILQQQEADGWGSKTIDTLSTDLKVEFPDIKGFSIRNLKYMRAFAEAYPQFLFVQQDSAQNILSKGTIEENENYSNTLIVQQAVAQLPWGHHIVILTKTKTVKEKIFYIQKAVENNWSRDILKVQIESKLLERTGTSLNNFENTLPAQYSDLANATFKNPYLFDFLAMGEKMQERDLEKALTTHLKKFMLELGKGFAYVGNQYNLNVAGDDFFLDLLFYNLHLRCYVLFELKIGEFKPEFAGKLNFYVNTVDVELKGEADKPTIGILLCKTPNETVVKYALHGIRTPMGIAEYELADMLPKELKGEFPTVEELEKEIDEEYEELKTPTQKRFEALKEKLEQINENEIKQEATTDILFDIIDNSLHPLFKKLIEEMQKFRDLFHSGTYDWQGVENNTRELDEFPKIWKNDKFLRSNNTVNFYYHLNGFLKGGTETFGIYFSIGFFYQNYSYGITVNHAQQPLIKKLYHERITQQEIDLIIDSISDYMIERINSEVEKLQTKR